MLEANLQLFRDAHFGVALFDDALSCVGANPSLARAVGVADESELVGWGADRVLPAIPGMRERLVQVLCSGVPEDLESEVVHADGGATVRRAWQVSIFPVRRGGGVAGVGALVTEITEHRRVVDELRVHEEWFRSTLEAIPQMVWVGAADGANIYNNARLSQYTGLAPEALHGDGWTRAVHPDDLRTAYTVWTRAVKAKEPFTLVERVRRHDGEYRWFLAAGAPLRDRSGRVIRWIGTWTDIHDRVEAQQELQQADRRKNEFLAMLSHELRNPLAPIQMAINVLERADPAGEQARRAKEVLARQTALLSRLVGDLLDVTRIGRGKIELRRSRVDLVDLVTRIVEDHRGLFRERGIAFALDVPGRPVWVDADEARLSQVFGNLLQNAAKFTPDSGHAALTLSAEGGDAVATVRDTGVGIDPVLLARVFEPFTQGAQSLARTSGGLGLGLALVKGLTQLHGGSVSVRSRGAGQGAEFTLRLPLAATPAGAIAQTDPGERTA